jgi:hypothetical protein
MYAAYWSHRTYAPHHGTHDHIAYRFAAGAIMAIASRFAASTDLS